jgi:hypothetical protein
MLTKRCCNALASFTEATGSVGVVVAFVATCGDAVAAAPRPPQAATARAVSGITAALARRVIGLLHVMSFGPEIDGRSKAGASNHAPRSPRSKTS